MTLVFEAHHIFTTALYNDPRVASFLDDAGFFKHSHANKIGLFLDAETAGVAGNNAIFSDSGFGGTVLRDEPAALSAFKTAAKDALKKRQANR